VRLGAPITQLSGFVERAEQDRHFGEVEGDAFGKPGEWFLFTVHDKTCTKAPDWIMGARSLPLRHVLIAERT